MLTRISEGAWYAALRPLALSAVYLARLPMPVGEHERPPRAVTPPSGTFMRALLFTLVVLTVACGDVGATATSEKTMDGGTRAEADRDADTDACVDYGGNTYPLECCIAQQATRLFAIQHDACSVDADCAIVGFPCGAEAYPIDRRYLADAEKIWKGHPSYPCLFHPGPDPNYTFSICFDGHCVLSDCGEGSCLVIEDYDGGMCWL